MIQVSSGKMHPYLEALRVSGVPAELILREAEEMGYDPDELFRIAQILLGCDPDPFLSSLWVLIGFSRNWQPFVAKAIAHGLSFLLPLLHPPMGSSGIDLLGKERRERFAPVILARLNYPKILLGSHPLPVNPANVLPWLEGGGCLWTWTLELQGFTASSFVWESILAETLILRDAVGPDMLRREFWGSAYTGHSDPVVRLFRVSRLRILLGDRALHSLTAVSCPDLAKIGFASKILVIKDCPSISDLECRSRGSLLHLQRCAGLQSISMAGPLNQALSCQSIVIDDCPNLRTLPDQIKIGGNLVLRRMGSFSRWPSLIQIGGDLRIQNCGDLEELPPLEVSGSLRVTGPSGLRRLAPGTVIGKHLDLRACSQLEGLPHGVSVGGPTYLPPHLHQQAPAFKPTKPLLNVP